MDQLKTCTLLYVEDEPALRIEMQAFLDIYLRRVCAVANGVEALKAIADNEIDLVLTDIRMPEMDGLALAERLRELRPELPVVLYTAFSDVPTLLRGIELGVAGFVQKPTDAGKLIETLKRAALPVLQRRKIAQLSRELQSAVCAPARNAAPVPLASRDEAVPQPPANLPMTMTAVEKWAILRALDTAGGKRMAAARLLGMNYYTFRRHLARHGLETGIDD